MRDQVTKVKDKIKEPSWWNAIKLVLKKHPSSTSSAQPALASCAESLSLPGQSVSKSFRPPASQENLVVGYPIITISPLLGLHAETINASMLMKNSVFQVKLIVKGTSDSLNVD